jgi:nitroreductase
LDVFEAIYGRRSNRKFRSNPPPKEAIEKILDAGRYAPSAGNVQPWKFIVIRNDETRRKLAYAALSQGFIAEAPVNIVVCVDLVEARTSYGVRGETLYCIQDTAAAIENMLLAAYALGLGTCWVGAFNEEAVSRILDIPAGYRPIAIIPVGYPDEKPRPRPRKSLKEIVNFEKF